MHHKWQVRSKEQDKEGNKKNKKTLQLKAIFVPFQYYDIPLRGQSGGEGEAGPVQH